MGQYDELVRALRCESVMYDEQPKCDSCRYGEIVYYGQHENIYGCDSRRIENAAADLIEAQQVDLRRADEIIAEGIEVSRKSRAALETAQKLIAELEKQDSVEMHKKQVARIAELEAQLPKEGEWVESNRRPRSAQFYCSVCHRTCYDIQPTRNKAWTKRCRYRYCPNCGARMKGEQNG